jgi:5-methylcytosine-specific restriction endonuclease McrA
MNYTGQRAKQKFEEDSRIETKRKRKAEELAAWKAVCKQVDARDGGRCRACGRRCNPNALGMLERAERHHITYRSLGGEDFDDNVVTLCAGCHADQHAGRMDVRGNARVAIEIWRRDVDGGWYLSRRETAVGQWERD